MRFFDQPTKRQAGHRLKASTATLRPAYRWLDPAPPAVQAIRARRELQARRVATASWLEEQLRLRSVKSAGGPI